MERPMGRRTEIRKIFEKNVAHEVQECDLLYEFGERKPLEPMEVEVKVNQTNSIAAIEYSKGVSLIHFYSWSTGGHPFACSFTVQPMARSRHRLKLMLV